MQLLRFLAVTLAVLAAAPAQARVQVVTAYQDQAWITQSVGGSQVSVDYLAGSSLDPHLVDPRPSQVVKLSRARMLVRHGMSLDPWLDPLIRSAGNSGIQPGAPGYVDASRGIRALEVPTGKIDPSMGDIHPQGNPHYLYGPSNFRVAARNITEGLKRVDRAHAAEYEARLQALLGRLEAAQARWKSRMAPLRGRQVVAYHRSLVYFFDEMGLREFGHVEPRPGLEPTPGHVSGLSRRMKEAGIRVIVTENFRPRRFADLLARQSGARVVVVPGGVGAEKGVDDYFAVVDAMVDRIAGAL